MCGNTENGVMYLPCFAGIQLLPDLIQRLCPASVEWLAEERDEGEPIDGALMQESLLEYLPFKFLEEYPILIEGLC